MKKQIISFVFITFFWAGLSNMAFAATAQVSWIANTESDLAGYKVYYGLTSGNYMANIDAGLSTGQDISGLQSDTTYYMAVTAYDTSSNESIYSVEFVYTVAADVLIQTPTPSNYVDALINSGDSFYIDDNRTITSIPAELQNSVWLKTADADASETASNYVQFNVDRDAIVYVGYDSSATSVPDWLKDSFVLRNINGITANNGADSFDMWARNYPAGAVSLGGNMAPSAQGATNNYIILVQAMDTSITPPDDGDNMLNSWEDSVGLDRAIFDAHDDTDVDGFTNLQEFWMQSDPIDPNSPNGTSTGPNVAPVLTVPTSYISTVNTQVNIVATATDADVGDTLSWAWSQTSGPAIDLSSIPLTNSSFSFTPIVSGLYTIGVIVRDNQNASAAETIRIEVLDEILESIETANAADIVISDGAELHIPNGGLDQSYQVAIGYRALPAALPTGHDLVSRVVHYSPDAVQLLVPATIHLPYDISLQVTSLQNNTDLALLRYDMNAGAWVELTSATDQGQTVQASVNQLGTFVVTSVVTGSTTGTQSSTQGGGGGGGAVLLFPILLPILMWRRRMAQTRVSK